MIGALKGLWRRVCSRQPRKPINPLVVVIVQRAGGRYCQLMTEQDAYSLVGRVSGCQVTIQDREGVRHDRTGRR